MKELINFCRQTSPYADSKGLCLVELEDDKIISIKNNNGNNGVKRYVCLIV